VFLAQLQPSNISPLIYTPSLDTSLILANSFSLTCEEYITSSNDHASYPWDGFLCILVTSYFIAVKKPYGLKKYAKTKVSGLFLFNQSLNYWFLLVKL